MAASAPSGLPLAAIVRALRRSALLIVVGGVVGAAAAYAYARTLPKSYTASSLIAVAGSGFAIPELQGALRPENAADPMPLVRTEMQALTARDLVTRVVQELQLNKLPEFNSDLRPPSLVSAVKGWVQSFMPSTQEPAGVSDPLNGVIGAVTNNVRIFQDNRSLAIDVGFISQDPALSATVANTLVGDYMKIRASRQSRANTGATEALSDRITQVRNEISTLEDQIRTLRTSNGTVLLRAGSVGQQQLEDLASAAAKAAVERGQLVANYNRATVLASQGNSAALASVLSSPTVAQLREREAAASGRVAELSSRYGANYPGIASAQAELSAARSQVAGETQRIISSLGTQVRVAREHEADIAKQLEDARSAAVGSENARAELKRLEDEVESRRKLYQTMLERAQQVAGAPTTEKTPDVYVISTAAAPSGPSGPNMKLAAGFGGIGGATLISLLALLRLRQVSAPATPEAPALTGLTGLSVAATLTGAALRRAKGGDALTTDDAAVADQLAGAVRKLGRGRRPKLVLFADASSRDEAAAVAAFFARTAFARGDRVLLIDANLRRTGTVPGMPAPTRDLLSLLDGREWPDPTPAAAACLEYYAAGMPAAAATRLLSEPIFANLLTQVREGFDTVVLLAPSVDVPETAALARQVDVGLLVCGKAAPLPAVSRFVSQGQGGSGSGPVALVSTAA
ncbi:MAG: exopolysaccharide transport family protein [Janthinobacterium lividum]